MSQSSIPNLKQQISNADINPQGLVSWDGANGLESILENLSDTLGARGVLYFNSTSQMALASGSDSGYAICPISGVLSIYKFFPNIDETVSGAVTSSGYGQWRPIFSISSFDGYWELSGTDLVPVSTIIGKAGLFLGGSGEEDLWLDMPNIDSDGNAKGARISPMTTSIMNSMTTPTDWMMVTNTESRMLLMQHPSIGFKSVGVFAGTITSGTVAASKISVTIPSQFVTAYKVMISATDSATAAAIASGFYISNKYSTSFEITFLSFASGTINFDFQISH